jgi:hypothetical protein
VNKSISTNEQAFKQEGLARLTTLLKAVPFVKSVKVEPQLGDHGWDAEVSVQTTTGGRKTEFFCYSVSARESLRAA